MPEPHRPHASLPTGAMTFLFTDIEGSTRLWEEDPERMRPALVWHDAISRASVESNRGLVVKSTGDGVYAAFNNALDALRAAVDLQQALDDPAATSGVPLRVRCGLHTGMVEKRDNDFFGPPPNRAARIMSAAHGGQVLLSQAVVDDMREILPASVSLLDLGRVRLKDLLTPEHVYQVVHPKLRQDFPALRSLEATPNNLSQQATSFIGREEELAEVKKLLGNARLLTLVGAGGIGKTRLSLQLAADVLDDHPDGVWFVDLARLSDPAYVPHALAQVLGLREESGKPLLQTLCVHAKSRRMLLVLDNCEHLIDACAGLADKLLHESRDLQILATTREPLHIPGEQVFPLGELSLPISNADLPEVARSQAVQLFVDRGRSQVPHFTLTEDNVTAVAKVCTRLDGIPLALELAAACMSTLPVEMIAERLSDRFGLLNRGSRLALPRQRTLRAMLDWSYDLLTDAEKTLFARLSVFAGGWSLEAAESVASGADIAPVAIVDLLTNLVEKSLVVVEQGGQRYRMLETIHEYARERLSEEPAPEVTHLRHRDYFMAMAETAAPALDRPGRDQSMWLEKLESEQANLRVSLAWSLEEPEVNEAALLLCGFLERFWLRQAQSREGRKWCDAAVARAGGTGSTAVFAKALLAAGTFAYRLGDYGPARTSLERALAIAKALDDRILHTRVLLRLGVAASLQGDVAKAQASYEEAIAACRETGDRDREGAALINLAGFEMNEGNLAAAIERLHCALSLSRELNDRALEASVLQLMSDEAWYRSDLDAAHEHCERSLSILHAMGAQTAEADSLRSRAKIARARGDFELARRSFLDAFAASREHGDPGYLDEIAIMAMALLKPEDAAHFIGAADALRHAFGLAIWPVDRRHFHGYRKECQSVLGKARYDAAYAAGRALNPEGVVETTRSWLQNIEGDVASARSPRVSEK